MSHFRRNVEPPINASFRGDNFSSMTPSTTPLPYPRPACTAVRSWAAGRRKYTISIMCALRVSAYTCTYFWVSNCCMERFRKTPLWLLHTSSLTTVYSESVFLWCSHQYRVGRKKPYKLWKATTTSISDVTVHLYAYRQDTHVQQQYQTTHTWPSSLRKGASESCLTISWCSLNASYSLRLPQKAMQSREVKTA